MAKIIYGVHGSGFGHAIRSKVAIDYLRKQHDVSIVSGGKAYEYLSNFYNPIKKIFSFDLIYVNNKVKIIKSFYYNYIKHASKIRETFTVLKDTFKNNKPDLVITDFEFFTEKISKKFKIPCISVGNNHIVVKCKIDVPLLEIISYFYTKLLTNFFINYPQYYLIPTFFFPKTKKEKIFLIAPILRNEFVNISTEFNDYIFVYQTSDSNNDLIRVLKKINEKFIVYGFNKQEQHKNIIFKKFNFDIFYKDISNCKAVITNGGFSLICESLALKKPVLSIPIRKQFEQICNGNYIKKLGFGESNKKATKENIEHFIKQLPYYKNNLKEYRPEINTQFFKVLDVVIKKIMKKK